jgi:hypothetical protein
VEASSQGTRKQVGEREQPTLAAVENVEILDRLVDLAVFEVADPVAVVASKQHADEEWRKCRCSGVGSSANGLIVTLRCRRPTSRYRPPSSVASFR